jgi:hypothetical protein
MLAAGGCSSTPETMDSGADTGGQPDTTSGDAPADTKVKDTTPPDNQAMCPTPTPLMNFMPPAYVPPKPLQSVCTQQQIQGFWDNCRNLGTSTAQTCMTWSNANAACYGCVFSMQNDSTWGAMIYRNNISFVNTAGCLDLLGDKTCAKASEDLTACEAAACDKMCPVTDFFAADHASTLADWQKCSSTVTMGGDCTSFVNAVNMKCNADAGSTATCFGQQGDTFQTLYFKLAPIFCTSGG